MYLEFQLSGLGSAPISADSQKAFTFAACQTKPFPWDSLHPLCSPAPWTFSVCFLRRYFTFSWYYFRSMTNILHIHGSLPGIMLTLYLTGIALSFHGLREGLIILNAVQKTDWGAGGKINGHTDTLTLCAHSIARLQSWRHGPEGDRRYKRQGRDPENTECFTCGHSNHTVQILWWWQGSTSVPTSHSLSIQESFLDTLSPFLRKLQGYCRLALCFSRSSEVTDPGEMTQDVRRATSASLTSPVPWSWQTRLTFLFTLKFLV